MGTNTSRSTLTRRAVAVLAATLVGAAGVIVPVSSANAASNGDWSAYPKRASTEGPQFTPRQYFFFDLAPGGKINDSTTISNARKVPLTLDVYPADAFNVRAGGGFALNPQDKPQTGVGSWVTLDTERVTIPAAKTVKGKLVEGKVNVPFTLTVPKNATPGDHAGGIVTAEPTPSTSVEGPSGAVVGVRRSLAVRIYTRVTGPLNPQLLVTNVKYMALKPAVMPFLGDQGYARIEYTYVNNGNVRITPTNTTTFKGFLGRTLHSNTEPIPEILPGQTITLTSSVKDMPVLDQVVARVDLKGDSRVDRVAANVQASGDTAGWSISWIFVGVLLLIIVGVVVWRIRKSRAKKVQTGRRRVAPPVTPTPAA